MLKLQYFGHLIRRANSLEKTLILGKIERRRDHTGRGLGWCPVLRVNTVGHMSRGHRLDLWSGTKNNFFISVLVRIGYVIL